MAHPKETKAAVRADYIGGMPLDLAAVKNNVPAVTARRCEGQSPEHFKVSRALGLDDAAKPRRVKLQITFPRQVLEEIKNVDAIASEPKVRIVDRDC